MSCEEARAEVERAWAEWKVALDKHVSLVNLGGVTVVDEDGARAIEEAGREFADADQRFLLALQAHLAANASHRRIGRN